MICKIFVAIQLFSLSIFVAGCRLQTAASLPSESMIVVPAGWFLMGQNEGPHF
jgi:hypothetical protein